MYLIQILLPRQDGHGETVAHAVFQQTREELLRHSVA
jgi:hypothetical protein